MARELESVLMALVFSRCNSPASSTCLISLLSTLDIADKEFLDEKVDIIQSVYKRLTTKDVVLDFKADPVFYTIRKP